MLYTEYNKYNIDACGAILASTHENKEVAYL